MKERRGRASKVNGIAKGRPPNLDKKIDEDLMVGILLVPSNTASSRSGCSKYDLDYDAFRSNPCNQIAMETGMALLKKSNSLGTKLLIEMVVYRKSTNRVVIHEVYSVKN